MYKYVALDFDGTLLRENHDISERSIEILKKLQKEGVIIILCSGRNISQMNFVAEKINSDDHDTFIISDNGGVVTVVNQGNRTTLRNAKFRASELKAIMKEAEGKTKALVSFNDGVRYLRYFNTNEFMRAYFRFGEVSKLGIPNEASKILMIDKKEKIESIYQQVKGDILAKYPHLNVFRSVPTLIEITPSGSTKGEGLKMVFNLMGWNLDELIVFGDGENDISMFEVAGKAIAMENAFDTVKVYANDICLSNNEDGVAVYLEQMYQDIL